MRKYVNAKVHFGHSFLDNLVHLKFSPYEYGTSFRVGRQPVTVTVEWLDNHVHLKFSPYECGTAFRVG